MGRPRDSAPRSYYLIYERLKRADQKEVDILLNKKDYYGNLKLHLNLSGGKEKPFWLDDWRSTGLKDRTAIHKRLKHLVKLGLVLRFRQGHRFLYVINPEKDTLKNWVPLLWGKEKAKRILRPLSKRDIKDLESWRKKILTEIIKPIVKLQVNVGDAYKWDEDQKIIEQLVKLKPFASYKKPKSGTKSIPSLERIYYGLRHIFDLWDQYLSYWICPECLHDYPEPSWTTEDPETGEIHCQRCGFVAPITRLADRVQPLKPEEWKLQYTERRKK